LFFINYQATEIETYTNTVEQLGDNDYIDVEQFWTSNAMLLENLICVARKYLCVPATSSPVERLFSYSGYIFRPHRQRLTTNKLEKLTMLKTMKFVDNEININSKIVQHEDLD
jgi:hypothetical protein